MTTRKKWKPIKIIFFPNIHILLLSKYAYIAISQFFNKIIKWFDFVDSKFRVWKTFGMVYPDKLRNQVIFHLLYIFSAAQSRNNIKEVQIWILLICWLLRVFITKVKFPYLRRTLPFSFNIVNMTITTDPSCQTISQKSFTVAAFGPWVAIKAVSLL